MRTKNIISVTSLALLFTFSGCASKPITTQKTIIKPIVKQGEKSTLTTNERITFIPAGTPFPMKVKIEGDVFVDAQGTEVKMVLKEDLYIYIGTNEKVAWVSPDAKNWKTLSQSTHGSISLGAGYDQNGTFEGRFGLILDEK